MKKRITSEQLNELTDIQKQKLRDWWKPQEGDYFYAEKGLDVGLHLFQNCCSFSLDLHFGDEESNIEDSEFGGKWYIKDCLPILDIGKMIEIIHDYDNCLEIDSSSKWYLDTRCVKPNIKTDSEELCDTLWQAVKVIL